MTAARLRVTHAGPHVSFQDGGRFGNLRFGVPASGPMDRLAHAAANVAVGGHPDATAIEVSVGGLEVECLTGAVTAGVAGGEFAVQHAGAAGPSWNVVTIRPGERLAVRAGGWGSWSYLAVAGDIRVARWLGHTATHSMSGFGGGPLNPELEIEVVDARTDTAREGEIPPPEFARPTGRARVVMGPQDRHFEDAARSAFCETPFVLTDAYDRMGVRLNGPPLRLRTSLAIPSEPVIRGSVQVAGDGVATLLCADHQTTGGYPKIATVISADLDGLAQLRPGDAIRFEPITTSEAIAVTRAHATEVDDYLRAVSRPGRTLTNRLMGENLIGGAVSALDDDRRS